LTTAILLILTLVGIDVALSCIKARWPRFAVVVDGSPLLLFSHEGQNQTVMSKERIDEDDLLSAARRMRGLNDLDQVEYAVLEPTGDITIVPKARQDHPT
jgi:uncharacterized membrane protein YcaP (DUF421 family)